MQKTLVMIHPNTGARGTVSVKARHGTVSPPPAREQPADMQDDMTALQTTPYHMSYLPMPSLTHIIPRPPSDRCDIGGLPVPPSRRSAPAISRFNLVLGWRTFLQLLARRAAESIAFSVPDRNALCIKVYYQAVLGVLIDSMVELLGLIIKPFDHQTGSWNPVSNDLIIKSFDISYLLISDSAMWKRLHNVYSQIKQTRLKPLSQPIWQPPPLHPVSYQPPTHRRLLAFPVFVFIIGEGSFVISRQFGIHSCLQCAFQRLVHSAFLESIILFSSCSKDSLNPASRSRATTLSPVLSYPLQRTLQRPSMIA